MDKKLKMKKLKMWRDNLKKLEEQLLVVQQKKGAAAAQEEDLSAFEDADTLRAQIEQVKEIIKELEGEK